MFVHYCGRCWFLLWSFLGLLAVGIDCSCCYRSLWLNNPCCYWIKSAFCSELCTALLCFCRRRWTNTQQNSVRTSEGNSVISHENSRHRFPPICLSCLFALPVLKWGTRKGEEGKRMFFFFFLFFLGNHWCFYLPLLHFLHLKCWKLAALAWSQSKGHFPLSWMCDSYFWSGLACFLEKDWPRHRKNNQFPEPELSIGDAHDFRFQFCLCLLLNLCSL